MTLTALRLGGRRRIDRVRIGGVSVRVGNFRARALPNSEGRLRVAVAAAHCVTAVERNRVRRRVRAALRDAAPAMSADVLLSALPEAANMPFDELRRLTAEAVSRAAGAVA